MNALDDGFRADLAREPDFVLGGAAVHPGTRAVDLGGGRETVEPQVMKVLVMLYRHRGEVVSRDELIRSCWNGRVVGEDAINRCLAKVRRLTGRMHGVTIETVPRVGYRLEETPPDEASRSSAVAGRSRRRALLAGGGLALLLLMLVLLGRWWPAGSAPSAPSAPTFAVLPLTSLNTGEEMHLYGKSTAAAAIDAFSRAGLPLASTAPVAPGPDRNPTDVGRALGADYVVSGTIRQEGDVVRAFARIDQVEGSVTVYSRMFELPRDEVRALPDLVAGGVAGAVTSVMPIIAREGDPRVRAGALRALLSEDSRRGLEVARDTLARAPASGVAQFVFALRSHHVLADHNTPEPDRRALIGPARAAAARARELLPTLGEGYILSCVLFPPVSERGCEEQLRRGLAVDPHSAWLPTHLAITLSEAGYVKEALQLRAGAHAADPFEPAKAGYYLYQLALVRRIERPETEPLIRAGERYWRADPSFVELRFKGLVGAGEMAAAQRLLDDPVAGPIVEPPGREQPIRAVLQAHRSRSAADLARARAECGSDWLPRDVAVATCLAGLSALGDLDGAFALADRVYPDRRPRSAQEAEDWFMRTGGSGYTRAFLFGDAAAPLRADPRFIGIAERTGLLAAWRARRPPAFCEVETAPVCDLLRRG